MPERLITRESVGRGATQHVVVSLKVNGVGRTINTHPDRPLLEVLREDLQLTGSRYGCGEGECGACSVLIDGKRAFSCSTSISELEGKSITTIEGLAQGNVLHPVQQAFLDEGAFQCGYCTSGMVINAVSLLTEKPDADERAIVEGMNGNLCRCCGYTKMITVCKRAAVAMKGGRP